MKRHVSLMIAAALPLFMFSAFMPTPSNQVDVWLLWLLAMVLLALPIMYAEIALAFRSAQLPVLGVQTLTREADVITLWRGFVWLNIAVLMSVSAWLVTQATHGVLPFLTNAGVELPNFALAVGLMIIATIISLLGVNTAIIALVCVLVGSVLASIQGFANFDLQMTAISLSEWGSATMMALVSMGVGTGLYWFFTIKGSAMTNTNQSDHNHASLQQVFKNKAASSVVLPIWGTQLLLGLFALAILSTSHPTTEQATSFTQASIAQLIINIGGLALAAALLHIINQLLNSRLGMLKGTLATLICVCVLVLVPSSLLLMLMVVFMTMSVMMLSIFTGWKMKISHLRKSLNFSNEGIYNIWRVAVRLMVPLSLLAGVAGWITRLL